MSGYLDQVDEYVYFGDDGDDRDGEGERMNSEREKAKILTTCSRVEDVVELITQYSAQHTLPSLN